MSDREDKQTEREALMAARLDAARARHAERAMGEVKAGQWRTAPWNDAPRVYRVMHDSVHTEVRVQYVNGGAELMWCVGDVSRDPLATPREVLDACLAMLPPEQRARVTVEGGGDGQVSCLLVDTNVYLVDGQIDSMLTALQNALAKPAPQESTAPDDVTYYGRRDVCEHGSLRRKCAICERDEEIALLRQAASFALDEVTKLRRTHADLGAAIDRLTALLGDGRDAHPFGDPAMCAGCHRRLAEKR